MEADEHGGTAGREIVRFIPNQKYYKNEQSEFKKNQNSYLTFSSESHFLCTQRINIRIK
jgi:lipopolysaccharide assembly outer membrane protein LptD (OstA)